MMFWPLIGVVTFLLLILIIKKKPKVTIQKIYFKVKFYNYVWNCWKC